MKLEKAIEIGNGPEPALNSPNRKDWLEAHKLGIEALKARKGFCPADRKGHRILLPGETED